MAWIEGETWEMEQGIDALKIFQLYEDQAQTTPWPFEGWDVNATISDINGHALYPVTVETVPLSGLIRLIFPESLVNSLKINGSYRYDCLMVSPGSVLADDHFLATGLVMVTMRTTRRDP